jgi:serine/threonine protein kinase
VGQPKLLQVPQERDSTPLEVQNSSKSKNNRIRKPEDFQLVSVVGQGGFGAVFLVKEHATGLVCAVKRMSKKDIVVKEQVGGKF